MFLLRPRSASLSIAGEVITPAAAGYDAARRVWNGAADRRPALIVRPGGDADVAAAVRHARALGLRIAVRGGGHGVAGHGTCDDCVVIDLSRMRAVRIDPQARTAHAQGGALWCDVDHTTQAFGLAVPGGMASRSGVAGQALGGGIGWLSRRHGLTCDGVRSARVVTADGDVVTADGEDHPDLLWALRGGGASPGVVTSLELRLHPVGRVLGGVLLHPIRRAGEVLRGLREALADAPDALAVLATFATVPALPAYPGALHGHRVLALGVCFAGPAREGERAIAPLRRLGEPLLDRVAVMPYAKRQRAHDAAQPAGRRNLWRSAPLAGLGDGLIDLLVERAWLTPSPFTQLRLFALGGAVAGAPHGAGAYPYRAAPWLLCVASQWTDPGADAHHAAWTHSFAGQLRPHAAAPDPAARRRRAEVLAAYLGDVFRPHGAVRP